MRKLLTLIAAMIMCDAYGATETTTWILDDDNFYESTTCNSGDNVTMPTQGNPQKNGFRFIGWKKLTEPENWKQMMYFPFTSYTPVDPGTSATTWTASGNYGTLTGSWRCSSTSGSLSSSCSDDGIGCTTNSNPSTSGTKQYCWCKGTKATFNGSTTNMSSSLAWVFDNDYSSASNCTFFCAYHCGYNGWIHSGFRRTVFGLGGA